MKYQNHSWAIMVRVMGAVFAVALILTAILEAKGTKGTLGEAWGLGLSFFALLLLLRVLGYPEFQPYILFEDDGIHYGRRQFIPWEKITRVEMIERRSGKRHLVLRSSGWRAAGLLARVIERSALPLSAFDRRQPLETWLEPLRNHAPWLDLPTHAG